MELHQLRGFFEIARGGSFTRAADKLYLTQPAISLQVKALEEELGEVLLDRSRKAVRLTVAGEILFRQTREIFGHLTTAREEIAALGDVLSGRLVIGTSDTNCIYVLPELLQRFRDRFPEVELDMRNKMSPEVCQLVLDDEVDFGLATLPARHRRLSNEKLFTRQDVLVCPPDHPLGGRIRVQLATVAAYPMLVLEHGSRTRVLVEETFHQIHLDLQIAMSLGSVEVIKRFVEIGMGIALVPKVAVAEEKVAGRLRVISVTGLASRATGLIMHCGRRRSLAAQAFIAMLREHLKGRAL